MTDPQDVEFLSKQSLRDFPKALVGVGDHSIRFVEIHQVCAEWLVMRDALTTMATSDDEWYVYQTSMRDYARKTLGMEVGEDD